MPTTFLEYGIAFSTRPSCALSACVKNLVALISKGLSEKRWQVTTDQQYFGLTVALEHISNKAAVNPKDPFRFVLFADREDKLARLNACLQTWPNNARGVIVLTGPNKDTSLAGEVQSFILGSNSRKKITVYLEEKAVEDEDTFLQVINHLKA